MYFINPTSDGDDEIWYDDDDLKVNGGDDFDEFHYIGKDNGNVSKSV